MEMDEWILLWYHFYLFISLNIIIIDTHYLICRVHLQYNRSTQPVIARVMHHVFIIFVEQIFSTIQVLLMTSTETIKLIFFAGYANNYISYMSVQPRSLTCWEHFSVIGASCIQATSRFLNTYYYQYDWDSS